MLASGRRVLVLTLLLATPAMAGCATDDAGIPPGGDDATAPDDDPTVPGDDGGDGGDEPGSGEAPPDGELPKVRLERVVSGLQNPTLVTHAGDGSQRLFVLEQPGRVRLVEDGQLDPEPYLDLTDRIGSGGERGLLGLAFAPDFPASGALVVSYTDTRGDSVLERFTVDDPATDRPDPDAGTVLLTQAQPYSNHNGGHLAFGPDGHLYLGLGDGGSGGDPQGHAQDTSTWLGSLLRLDVTGDEATAPEDNPFVGREGRDEIWAYGLRNPWRFTFDRATGDLYIGDVGQNSWEEIDRQPAASPGGENYGWDRWEGNHVFEGDPGREGFTFPILEYAREEGRCSVTGGYVYRGDAIDGLEGRYLYGDFCSGTVWAAHEGADGWTSEVLLETEHRISSFGEDEAGELYIVGHGGSVHRLVAG